MKKTWNFEHCVTILSGEIELLKEIASIHEKVRQAVMNREWEDFEEKTNELNRLGEDFDRLENERLLLFSEEAEEKSFYTSIMELPSEQRGQLSQLYRDLKMETFKMRSLNETFLDYLNEAKNIATAYIDAVCPERRGNLYTRKGSRVSKDLRSMVVNNSL